MADRYRRTATLVWAMLCLLSFSAVVVSGGLSHHAAGAAFAFSSSLVLVIAFIKVRLIVLHFMEVADSPLALRLIFEGWMIGALAILLALFHLNALEAVVFGQAG